MHSNLICLGLSSAPDINSPIQFYKLGVNECSGHDLFAIQFNKSGVNKCSGHDLIKIQFNKPESNFINLGLNPLRTLV